LENHSLIYKELLSQVKFIRKRLRETVNVFDWKQLLIPQLTLVGALACSTFSLYKFSLVSYSIFFGSFSILALVYWIYQCFRNKQVADQVQDMGLEVCARVTSQAVDKDVIKEGRELYREIEMHEALLNEETSRVGTTILIYMALFLAWMVFTAGDISPSISRYEATFVGNIFIFIAVFLVIRGLKEFRD